MPRMCRVCGGKLKKVFSLGKQPYANNLVNKPKRKPGVYPLDLYQCQHCTLMQLGYIAPRENLFKDYLYIPSVSTTHMQHFDRLSLTLIDDVPLKKNDLVVDIGSSDGSLLRYFRMKGMEVAGVEPAKNLVAIAKATYGILTYRSYFDEKIAEKIVKEHGKAKLATATNVFAHVNNLKEFVRALDILLDEDGVFFAQFPDVRNLLKGNQFDTIYHEHLSYFTYEPLHHLFAGTKFELYKVDSSTIHGGSMRIYVRRRTALVEDFVRNVSKIKKDLRDYIVKKKKEGKKIAGFGAAAKGVVLLNYCELDSKLIDYVADGTAMKQGKYIPGVNIPIYPEEHLIKDKPDVVLILAWNFKEEIMEKLKHLDCEFVVPIPEVEVYEKSSNIR